MKILLIAILSLTAFGAVAQEITCLDKLMPTSRFSGLHQLTKEEWAEPGIMIDAEVSKLAIKALVGGKLFCKPDEVKIKVDPVCTTVIPDLPQSQSCFVFTNIGYFVITKDSGKNTNFIFSKDKKFAE